MNTETACPRERLDVRYIAGSFSPPIGDCSGAPPSVAQRVTKLFRNNIPETARMGEVPGLAGQRLHIHPRASPRVLLADPETRRLFFAAT